MLKKILPICGIVIAIHAAWAADKLPKPDRIPEPPTQEQLLLIREGVALHDQQNYEAAIAKYKQVLAENPWEVRALHELAFTYFASKNYQAALETGLLGAQCRSEGLVGFYLVIGNALDDLGRGDEAIQTYQSAIKLNPRVALLHYNLAVSLRRAGKQKEAKTAVEKALTFDPNHASSHALLGEIYQEMGYRIPTVFAYTRFLVLEPESPRASKVVPKLLSVLTQGVGKGNKPNEVTIFMSPISKDHNDEGDFTSVEMMISVVLAADLMIKPEDAKKIPQSPFQKLASLYNTLGESVTNSKSKGGFAAAYYAPYFAALSKAGHTEALVARAWSATTVDGAADWTNSNEAKSEAFLQWSKEYVWPEK